MAVGERIRHVDWARRTAGDIAFSADVRLEGMLHARFLRSPHPHARVTRLDVSAAARATGVAAVVTAADLPDRRYVHHGGPLSDRRVAARGVVRFVGEEVAAVAAETREQAEAALRLIRVDYEPLPGVLSVDDALAEGAPLVHEARPGNVAFQFKRQYGVPPVDGAVAVTKRARFRFGRQAHACMEPGSTVARWDAGRGKLEVWTSTQAPYFIRKEMAHVLDLSMDDVEVHEIGVGGGFGAKSKISDHEVLTAALAMRARRPVKGVLDRDEEFSTTKCRHAFDIDLESSADAEGRLLHRTARIRVDNGAYNHSGPSVMGYGAMLLGSQYRLDGVGIDAQLVYTNHHPGGQFRGYGGPQVIFALESQVDELADGLGIDPIDLRIRNANRAGDTTLAGWRIVSSALVECLERVREAIDWDAKRARGGSGRGVGVAVAVHVSGARVYEGAERSEAGVDVGLDGRVRVRFGGADAGTWQRTMLAQVAATELGVGVDAVDTVMMETAETPTDLGAWSSRGTYMSGHAVGRAARAAADALRELAAGKFDCRPEDVELAGGAAVVDGRRVAIGDLVGLSDRQVDGELRVEEAFVTTDADPFDPVSGIANLSATYSFAAQAVEVEVDRATGKVRVLDVVAAHDSGIALNPISVESQIIGGVTMGLGAALGEEMVYAEGRHANPAYLDYALPRAADVPPIRPILVEHADPNGPYGAKGIGEICLIPTAAAVANAVAHAVGVRVRDLPITPDKVLAGLIANEGRRRHRARVWRRPDRWWIAAVRWGYPRGLHRLLHTHGTRLARRRTAPPVAELRRPTDAAEAATALAADRSARPLGGGTDLLPARRQGVADGRVLVDLTSVVGMNAVAESAGGDLCIGGAVTLADLARRPELAGDEALLDTIGSIASQQIREMATVGGNLCQQKRCWFYRSGFDCYKRGGVTCPCYAVTGDHRFYHAAIGAHRCQAVTPSDLATTFTALDASLAVRGPGGTRTVPMEEFFSGPGETVLGRGELVEEVVVAAAARRRATVLEKLRLWEGDFAVASVCVSADLADGVVRDCRIVLGAMAPTPYRARPAEDLLRGRRLTGQLAERAARACVEEGHPLPGNAWKLEAARGMVARCLGRLAEAT